MKYFLAGIKGTGMAGLASMLCDMGNIVCGYDDATYYTFTEEVLKERNIPIYEDINNLTSDMIFVYSTALPNDHKAILKAKELGCQIYYYSQMLGELTKKYDTICVSGTHGKTTTTSMISKILDNSIGTNYLIGAGDGKVNKDSNLFVLEACEFDRHFLLYDAKYTIITNIELDHVDSYKNIEETIDAFGKMVDNTKEKVIACGDDLNVRKLKSNQIIYYGFNEDNDIVAKNLILKPEGSNFDVYIKGDFIGHFSLPLYGKHMVLNALASIYISYILGVNPSDILESLKLYQTAKRRYNEEKIGDVIVVDDYAHHPTEVKTVIEVSRQKYPKKQVVAVLVPHTYSRTKAFYKDFADVLKLADKAYVSDVYPARELKEDYPGVDHTLITNLAPNSEHITPETIDKLLIHKNAVILFMSGTDPSWLLHPFKDLISKN